MYNSGKKNIWKLTITQSLDDFDSVRTTKEEMNKSRMRYQSIREIWVVFFDLPGCCYPAAGAASAVAAAGARSLAVRAICPAAGIACNLFVFLSSFCSAL